MRSRSFAIEHTSVDTLPEQRLDSARFVQYFDQQGVCARGSKRKGSIQFAASAR
jgi:hypothetical protein